MTLAILLLGLGLLLVAAELMFPSFGVLGVLAAGAIIGAIAMAFGISTSTGAGFLVATAILLPAVAIAALKLFPKTPMGRFMISPGLSHAGQAATDERDMALLGQQGLVESDCKPTGIARIGGRRIDVMSRGELIARGASIVVIEVSANRVVVAPVQGERP